MRPSFIYCVSFIALSISRLPNLDVQAGQSRVLDEWHFIDRIVVSTAPSDVTGLHELNTLAIFAIGMASRSNIRAIICTDEKDETQAEILKLLTSLNLKGDGKPVIGKVSDVVFVRSAMPSEWARDHAPTVVFSEPNRSGLRMFDTFAATSESVRCITELGRTARLPFYKTIPQVVFGDHKTPLKIPGGNWMTTRNGSTLLTTKTALLEHRSKSDDSNDLVLEAVKKSLRENFGITHVHALEPLRRKAGSYRLGNSHVDLQVRTMPNDRVFVARVPSGDEQHELLESNAALLTTAGFDVIRLDNASLELPREKETERKFFKTYTNSLFLNDLVLIPAYGDRAADLAAKAAYEKALSDAGPYVVVPIASAYGAAAIEYSGSIRCAVQGLHRIP